MGRGERVKRDGAAVDGRLAPQLNRHYIWPQRGGHPYWIWDEPLAFSQMLERLDQRVVDATVMQLGLGTQLVAWKPYLSLNALPIRA